MVNPGKIFEQQFKASAERQGIFIMRLRDSYIPAKALDKDSFIPCQPCDFILHYNGALCFAELKSTNKNYITIQRDKLGQIKKTQYDQLFKLQGENEFGGFLLQFNRDSDMKVFWLGINRFMEFLEESGKSSINLKDCEKIGVEIQSAVKKKKTWYDVKGVFLCK